ncbi:MAG: universal stress protein [Nitrososphaeria archaeon]|nr:universal stress protein [Nitrosopumilaceae archaeon]NIP09127.1 universal stress protein [Nitrosopumilaceae archaeon]NIP91655.1 universal stress protein [Nitrososphaeria archaeon]NIS95495.1 universal stress protein [Nitrosopumilaceae archaeon]
MVQIKKILVPLDGSKNSLRGLDEGIYLARQCQATITGLYVVPLAKPKTDSQISYIEKHLLTDAAKFMSKAKKRAAQNGILFEDKVVYGDEGKKIINYAETKSYDIIIIGSRGLGSLKEAFLGSTSNYVLHKSKLPVLIVK